jgi:hypothetical protein
MYLLVRLTVMDSDGYLIGDGFHEPQILNDRDYLMACVLRGLKLTQLPADQIQGFELFYFIWGFSVVSNIHNSIKVDGCHFSFI